MRSVRASFFLRTAFLGTAFSTAALAQVAPTAAPAQVGPSVGSVTITPAMAERAKTHAFRPAHIASVAVKEEPKQLTGVSLIPARRIVAKLGPAKPKLNVQKFGEDMHAALKDNVRGYTLQVRKGGAPIYTLIWEWSRSPAQGGKGWTLDTRMHVASVSKLITAIAAVKMLDERWLSFDTKIGNYVPTYWTMGNNAKDITFRDLLTHKAGFTDAYYDGDYMTFKGQLAAGVAASPGKNYTNGSFSLVRVLNATMTGAVSRDLQLPFGASGAFLPSVPTVGDAIWDNVTSRAFESYVQAKVFTPSGVSGITSTGSAASALAYSTKGDGSGWDSGELQTQLGGAGFRVSVNDMLNVMGAFRRKGTIVSPEKAQQALDAQLGIDVIDETPAGKSYLKNGWWGGGGQDGAAWHVEQAVACFLPDDMEVVVLVNSNIGAQGASLTTTFRNAVANNID